MTRLRKVMLEELQRRNFSPATIRSYVGSVERLARYFNKPPDQLGPEQIREYQAHLLHARKLKAETVVAQVAALRFFFIRTLKRRFPPDSTPYAKYPAHHLPKVLSPEEVAQLIDAARNLQARAMLMLLYSTGVRRSELVRLRVEDIDSKRMVVHIHQGKGGKDRDVPLCPRLLETLREYWRWKKPKPGCLFAAYPHAATSLSPTGRSGMLALKRPGMPVSRRPCLPTCCGTVSPRTCWRMAPTCPPSRS